MSSSLSPSSSSSFTYRIPIVTTTIVSPSATSYTQPENGHTTIPIGSIVGGCLAGVVLTIAAVVGWHLWGRRIRREDEARRKETISRHTTTRNTRLNAFTSSQSPYTPSFQKHTQDRKVKFASHTSDTQSSQLGQLPALHRASLPARPSPLSQSAVTIEQSTIG